MIALTREVSPDLGNGERTHVSRQAINIELAREQHARYESALAEAGCEIRRLPATPEFPDSVFVEDVVLALEELAILTRPGAESRRGEVSSVADVLSEHRTIHRIESPGTLDGGDVLQIGKRVHVGISGRTNEHGVKQLEELVSPHGYDVIRVRVDGCLHLKSAVTQIGQETILINRSWVDASIFSGMELIDVDPDEQYAANAVLVGEQLVYPTSFPRTRQILEDKGYNVNGVDVSELQKAEGAVTCCSVIFD